MNLDRRRLVDAQHLVRVEIALFDVTALQRDLAIERRGYPEHNTALDLRLHPTELWP